MSQDITLENLRRESNNELTKARPKSVEELTLMNELIALRKSALWLLDNVAWLEEQVVAESTTV